jgi:hypothetical protein
MNALWLRLTIATALLVAVAVILAALMVFLGVVGYLAMRDAVSPTFAAVMTGFATLILLAALALAIYTALKPLRSMAKRFADPRGQLLSDITGLVSGQLGSTMREHPYQSALVSLAAGFSVGAVPELRDILTKMLIKRGGLPF